MIFMYDWKKIALIIILVGGGLIVILGGIAIGQKIKQGQLAQIQQTETNTLATERAKGDALLAEVQTLRTEMDALVIPQVKLNLQP
jgi:hypothetical protein